MNFFLKIFFSYSFRPLFTAVGLFGIFSICWWTVIYLGGFGWPPIAMTPISWHAHEMVFGFVIPGMAGFLLTAVGNWTGRPPVQGIPLMLLLSLWIAGRLVISLSYLLHPLITALADLSFLVMFIYLFANEVIQSRDKRNYKIILFLVLLLFFNLLFHLEYTQFWPIPPRLSIHSSLMVILLLLGTIAGRIIPNFTRNWLMQHGHDQNKMPVVFNNFDRFTMIMTAVFAIFWIIFPYQKLTGAAAIVLGLLHFIRLSRWRGLATIKDLFVFILHIGYGWISIALVLLGISNFFEWLVIGSPVHALTIGVFTVLMVAIGSRASLGHTGRELKIGKTMKFSYLFLVSAAILRVGATFSGGYRALLYASVICWVSGLLLFMICYWPILTKPSLAK